jgi:hypothetical protein
VHEDCVGREGMQHVDDGFQPLKHINIELFKCTGLFLKYIKDRIGAIAAIDPDGEWVVAEIIPSLGGVLRQGCVKEHLKVGESGGCGTYRGHEMRGVGERERKGCWGAVLRSPISVEVSLKACDASCD